MHNTPMLDRGNPMVAALTQSFYVLLWLKTECNTYRPGVCLKMVTMNGPR